MDSELTFRIAFWVLLGGVFVMRVYFAIQVNQAGERLMPDKAAIAREGKGLFLTRFIGFFLLISLLILYAVNPPWMQVLLIPLPGWLRWVGFVLGLVSLAFWTWTQVALGQQWSAQLQLREEHHLITTGPYRRIRHPLYTGMFGWCISLALVTASWIFVVIAVLAIGGMVSRVPKEEQMMIEEFGDDYRGFMAKTGRFFPK